MNAAPSMNFLDRGLAFLFPGFALRRQAARLALGALSDSRSYGSDFEGIDYSRLNSDWSNTTRDADASNVMNLETLRNRIRQLRRNSGLVSGPIKRIANNVIGTGIRPQSRVKEDGPYDAPKDPTYAITKETAERFNYNAERLWKIHVEKMDSTLQQNFYEQQKLAFMAFFGDGEVLAVARASSKYGRIVPLCLELIEIDRLRSAIETITNPSIRNGIEFDEEGVPFKYHVLKRHPGANIVTRLAESDVEVIDSFDPVGQRKVFHLFDPLRPGQTRGYTPFAAGLKDIQHLDRLIEAYVVRSRVIACLAAFITPGQGAGGPFNNLPSARGAGKTDPIGARLKEFRPGMIEYLNPGDEVEINSAGTPDDQFAILMEKLMRNIANAVDIPYEVFANDWGNLNYSNARTVLIQAYLSFKCYQYYLITHLCKPVWELFITDCVAAGLLDAPGFGVRRHDYLRHSWLPPGWAWVDPLKESQAARSDLEGNLATLADTLAGKGDDWEETLEQRARELSKQKELEKKYDIKFPEAQPQQKPGTQPTSAADDDGKKTAKEEE